MQRKKKGVDRNNIHIIDKVALQVLKQRRCIMDT